MILSPDQQKDYLEKYIPYRLNTLMAWDLYISRRQANEYKDEAKDRKCYWESEFLDPAFEISIVFARSLIQFLGLSLRNNKLEYFVSKIDEDVQIWDVIPNKQPYPLSHLNPLEQKNLCNIIKIANNASAHMTTKFSTSEEFDSLIPGRKLLFKMVLDYVDNLDKKNCVGSTKRSSLVNIVAMLFMPLVVFN